MKKFSIFAFIIMAFLFAGCEPNTGIGEDIKPNENKKNGFSVSPDKQVMFSKGNLQYDQHSMLWTFANNQYEFIGEKNLTGHFYCNVVGCGGAHEGYSKLSHLIDLFLYSSDCDLAMWGVPSSPEANSLTYPFIDWGYNKIASDTPNTWYTLSHDELLYLMKGRTNASNLYAAATVGEVNGLILFPDKWKCPDDVIVNYGMALRSGAEHYSGHNKFSINQWSKLESAGAIFLPAGGYYSSNHYCHINGKFYRTKEIGESGYYHTNGGYMKFQSNKLTFHDYFIMWEGDVTMVGYNVRLVKNL